MKYHCAGDTEDSGVTMQDGKNVWSIYRRIKDLSSGHISNYRILDFVFYFKKAEYSLFVLFRVY